MRRPWTTAVVLPFLFACGTHARGPRSPREPTARLELSASDVTSVQIAHGGDSGDELSLDVALTPDASRRLEAFTTAHVGEQVAILVDGEKVMEPVVRDPIVDGHLEITGPSEGELQEMRRRLSTDEDPDD